MFRDRLLLCGRSMYRRKQDKALAECKHSKLMCAGHLLPTAVHKALTYVCVCVCVRVCVCVCICACVCTCVCVCMCISYLRVCCDLEVWQCVVLCSPAVLCDLLGVEKGERRNAVYTRVLWCLSTQQLPPAVWRESVPAVLSKVTILLACPDSISISVDTEGLNVIKRCAQCGAEMEGANLAK